jgi:hypothetical protein
MWGTPLTIVMLTAALAVVGYIALWAGRLDTRLGVLLQEQSEERRRVEREVERLRATGAPGC